MTTEGIKNIPKVKEWLLRYLYLDDDERELAKNNNLEWQFVFTIYEYSKRCKYIKIIPPFWKIAHKLQTTLNMLLECEIKDKYAQIFNRLSEMDQELQRDLSTNPRETITKGMTKGMTQSDCEIHQVCTFIQQYYIVCLKHLKQSPRQSSK
jgi:hypothetical protein